MGKLEMDRKIVVSVQGVCRELLDGLRQRRMDSGWHRVISQQDYQGSCLFPRRRKGQDPF